MSRCHNTQLQVTENLCDFVKLNHILYKRNGFTGADKKRRMATVLDCSCFCHIFHVCFLCFCCFLIFYIYVSPDVFVVSSFSSCMFLLVVYRCWLTVLGWWAHATTTATARGCRATHPAGRLPPGVGIGVTGPPCYPWPPPLTRLVAPGAAPPRGWQPRHPPAVQARTHLPPHHSSTGEMLLLLFLHSAQWFSIWDVYRYHPISHSSCSLTCNLWQLCHCDCNDHVRKYKRCSFVVRYWKIQHSSNE